MTGTTTDATDPPADATRHDPPQVVGIRALLGLQLYLVAAYISAAIIPYLWSVRPGPPKWMWIVPGWLLGVPGILITLSGPVLAVPLAFAGAWVLVLRRHDLSARLRGWCTVTTALTIAYALFSFTPLAHKLVVFMLD